MINSKLYNLRTEYQQTLQDRVEEQYTCPVCSKQESKCSIYKEDRVWESKIVCSCGQEYIYSTNAEYRGYVIGQYTYLLKKENPDIKIQFVEDSGVVPTTPAPVEQPKVFKEYKFKNSNKK